MSNHSEHASLPAKRHKAEGPKNHFLVYIVSILLTMLSFAIVIYGGLDHSFLIAFLLGLAITQAIFQVYIWMHGKERGHLLPLVFLFTGALVAVSVQFAAVYWSWW